MAVLQKKNLFSYGKYMKRVPKTDVFCERSLTSVTFWIQSTWISKDFLRIFSFFKQNKSPIKNYVGGQLKIAK